MIEVTAFDKGLEVFTVDTVSVEVGSTIDMEGLEDCIIRITNIRSHDEASGTAEVDVKYEWK